MTLEEVLRVLAPFAQRDGFDVEGVRARLASDKSRSDVLDGLRAAVALGQLTPRLWHSAASAAVPDDFTVAIATLWDSLVDGGLTGPAEGMPSNWTSDALRLWAYTNQWILISQDEDLLLMDEAILPDLLRLAGESGCPKREYILGLVAHWARDAAFAAAGTSRFRDFVNGLVQHESAARNAHAAALVEYFQRLRSYGVPATVHQNGALQRGLDLTRCSEPTPESVSVQREGKHWVVTLPGHTPKVIRVAQIDGRIS